MPLFTILILVLSTIPLAASAPSLRARRKASDKHPADVKNTTPGNDRKQQTQLRTSYNPADADPIFNPSFSTEIENEGQEKSAKVATDQKEQRNPPKADKRQTYGGFAHNTNTDSDYPKDDPGPVAFESIATNAQFEDRNEKRYYEDKTTNAPLVRKF